MYHGHVNMLAPSNRVSRNRSGPDGGAFAVIYYPTRSSDNESGLALVPLL
jgi:hypothetical protein